MSLLNVANRIILKFHSGSKMPIKGLPPPTWFLIKGNSVVCDRTMKSYKQCWNKSGIDSVNKCQNKTAWSISIWIILWQKQWAKWKCISFGGLTKQNLIIKLNKSFAMNSGWEVVYETGLFNRLYLLLWYCVSAGEERPTANRKLEYPRLCTCQTTSVVEQVMTRGWLVGCWIF